MVNLSCRVEPRSCDSLDSSRVSSYAQASQGTLQQLTTEEDTMKEMLENICIAKAPRRVDWLSSQWTMSYKEIQFRMANPPWLLARRARSGDSRTQMCYVNLWSPEGL